MIEPQNHPQEKIRLNVLRDTGLFNNIEESEYEKFVAIASALADTPIALLTLIDDKRQWFKAKVGLNVSETPKNVSFCGHAILSAQGNFIVEDAMYDLRFCDNPMVLGDPGIRFYAGIPLRLSKDRLPIGTLCVIDKKPRKLDDEKIKALEALGEVLEIFITDKIKISDLLTASKTATTVMKKRTK